MKHKLFIYNEQGALLSESEHSEYEDVMLAIHAWEHVEGELKIIYTRSKAF